MTTYRFGDILLLGFPQTNLKEISKRPAVVLYDAGDLDILVARVTSQEYFSATDPKIKKWKEAGLLVESFIRVAKIATLEKGMVLKKIGSLSSMDIRTLKEILEKMFK